MAKDYYEILGVSRTASPAEIKQAFRKLAHQHHPDKHGGDEQKFKEINAAYQVLSNPEKRRQYDQFGPAFEQGHGQPGFDFNDFASAFGGGRGGQNFSFDFGDVGDLFGDLFGGGSPRFGGEAGRSRQRSGGRTRVGADIEASLTISFEEAVKGVEKAVTLARDVSCEHCQGRGYDADVKLKTCSVCRGTGQVVRQVGFGIGFSAVCSECHGAGTRPEKVCPSCHGQGTTRVNQPLTIKIPAGINSGQAIRLTGRGHAVGGGTAGNLYARVTVTPHPDFQRQGDNIMSDRRISVSQAALGGSVSINTIEGEIKLKIPEGVQSGQEFRLKGKGVPHVNGHGRGDHLVRIIVETPARLNRRQKQLFEQLRDEGL